MATKTKLKIGDRVGYSKAFLQSIGEVTGDMPQARGIITAIATFGGASGTEVAKISWEGYAAGEMPASVNTANLWKVGTNSDA